MFDIVRKHNHSPMIIRRKAQNVLLKFSHILKIEPKIETQTKAHMWWRNTKITNPISLETKTIMENPHFGPRISSEFQTY